LEQLSIQRTNAIAELQSIDKQHQVVEKKIRANVLGKNQRLLR